MPAGLSSVLRRHRRGAVWTPILLPNLVLWLPAPSITGLDNNDPVGTAWLDLSGNGYNATVVGGSPTYKTNQQNGLPGVSFDGNDEMKSVFTTLSQPFTVYWVGNTVWGGSAQVVFDSESCTSQSVIRRFSATQYTITPPTDIFTSAADDNWHIVGGIWNGASGSARFDGTAKAENTGTSTLTSGLQIGAQCNDASFQVGVTGEIVVTSDAISADNITLLEHYFSAEWAIGAL